MKILIAIAGLILLMASCGDKKQKLEEGKVIVQPNIMDNPVYKKLDKEKDTREIFDHDTIPPAKTSDVFYFSDQNQKKLVDSTLARMYNCKSYLKADTLQIDIGIGGLFGGSGFLITLLNKRFSIKPYYVTDAVTIPPSAPVFKVIDQHLALNKASYKLGDSIFGKVKFKIIEHNNGDQKITHTAQGYFRSKIVKSPS